MPSRYAMSRDRSEVVEQINAIFDVDAGATPKSAIEPGDSAPAVVRGDLGHRFVRDMRWTLEAGQRPTAPVSGPPGGEAPVRSTSTATGWTITDVASLGWAPWLGPANRCLIPMTAFCAGEAGPGRPDWFALDESRPLAFIAGFWRPGIPLPAGEEPKRPNDAYSLLVTGANDDVTAAGALAMPVILTEVAEWDRWLGAEPWSEVADLQRPLQNGGLVIVRS